VAAVLILAGCGAATPPPGRPAAALVPALRQLAPAKLPVYLPSRLPAPPPGSHGYAIDAHATADSYDVAIYLYPTPVPVNAPVAVGRTGFIAELWGGTPGTLPPMFTPRFRGPRQRVGIGSGVTGSFYPGQGITWTEGGWTYAVTNSFAETAADVLPQAKAIQDQLGPAGNPIGSGRHFRVGAALARLQGVVGLRVLLERLPDLALDEPDPQTRPVGHEFRSLPRLRVRF
jgi:hypothetical protein